MTVNPYMQFIAAFFFIALPWINPFAPGPSPAVLPLLFSWGCAAALLGIWRAQSHLLSSPASRLATVTAYAWLFAGLLSSLMGLFQYFGAGANLMPWINQTELGQAFANLRQRNQFASLTNMALAALFWLASTASPTRYLQAGTLLAATLLAVGNASSSSRTGLVQLFLLCALGWIWGVRQRPLARKVLVTAALSYAVAVVVLPWLAGLDLSLYGMTARLRAGDEACVSRLTLWSNVLHLIAQKPWLGWGWGELDYAHYVTSYRGPRFCDILDNAHNLPLHLAVELGVPFAVLFCVGCTWWVQLQKPWRETDPVRQMAWSVLAVILLHSLLEYPLWYGPFQMALGLCIVFLWREQPANASGNARGNVKNQSSNKPLRHILRALLAIILISICGVAALDYRRVSQIYLPPESRDAALRDDTLAKIRSSWLFADQARFAELLLTPLTRDNARWTFDTATSLLHYSPEPRVIEKVIESAVLLGRDDEAQAHLAHYRAAFPADHGRWAKANAR
jgi:O-antigen ligase